MTDNNTGRSERSGGGRPDNPDLIDDALRLVDTLQRRLLVAGVKRGVSAVTSPPAKGDVWEEAIRVETQEQRPPLEEFVEIVRRSAPEVAGHLGRAGLSFADAVGRTWGVVERSFEQGREEAARAREEREEREREDRERDARARRDSPEASEGASRGADKAQGGEDSQVTAGD
ncbi:hypothetical protein [Nocardiopsis sp. L17-MgMaSL7]|uniref:hypothetical protein n=1 Tax=Nocardiopsis sp. L17-MgMaSL7 TaxID=1938893 RepID=UPI000D712554|nr:hypothetical protein [Nocardiopsis sp. L17-MgMaSL7]PWV46320.1 hypothetical protein BDW27_11443 [Nocardiopsis sp. L17-MgMaSL7]